MGSPALRLIGEGQSYWAALHGLLLASGVKGLLVHDASVAAIFMLHGVRKFWTVDQDFLRFPAPNCHNPLIV